MGFAYIKFFMENPEYLRLIFLSDIEKWIGNIGGTERNKYCPGGENPDHPFAIFYKAVERLKAETESAGGGPKDLDAMVLSCWGMVHGISILITRREFNYKGDYLELVKRIIWSDTFIM